MKNIKEKKSAVGKSLHGMDYAGGSVVCAYLQILWVVHFKYVKICMMLIFQ